MPEPLLKTKFHIPSVGAEFVLRPRLSERLDESQNRKLTLVSAPAGFGKTTLLSAWARQTQIPVAWLSLDESDNDPVQFSTYLIGALQSVYPGIGAAILPRLQTESASSMEPLLTRLLNEISETPEHSCLVLDDYHLIQNEDIHQALTFLIENLPEQNHLIIATRSDPPLPLSRLRARSQLLELREGELRFSTQEASTFLTERMALNLSAQDIQSLEERTEGWAVGLQLAALSMQGRSDVADFIEHFTGGHHYILEYLTEEVVSQQPEPIQQFLMKTSFLNRLNGPLCDAVTGGEQGQTTLLQLLRDNLFIQPLDDERYWYRYHHLFAEMLIKRLLSNRPGEIDELRMRAAGWCEKNGLVAQAVAYALEAGDFERAADLVEENAIMLFNRGELLAIMGLIRKLPASLVGTRPWLSVFYAFVLVTNGQLEGVEDLLQQAEGHILISASGQETRDLEAAIATIRGQAANLSGDYDLAIELNQFARQTISADNWLVRVHINYSLGDVYYKTGDLEAASQAFSEGLEIGRMTQSSMLYLPFLYDLAHIRKLQGQLHQARRLYAEAEQYVEVHSEQEARVMCPLEIGLGDLLYEWNDLGAAASHTRHGIELSEIHGTASSLANGYYNLLRLFHARGDTQAALEALRKADETTQRYHMVKNPGDLIDAWRVQLYLAAGDIPSAEAWVEQNLEADEPASPLHPERQIILARLRFAQKQPVEALLILDPLYKELLAAGRTENVIQVLILQAIIWQDQGETDQALTALGEALELAAPQGYVRTFLDEGAQMVHLLTLVREHAPRHSAYADQLLAANEPQAVAPSPAAQPSQALIDPLSERELEVLQLICDGCSNQQISERLFISLHTVKKHTTHIYRKLGVSSRTQAIVQAQELRLV